MGCNCGGAKRSSGSSGSRQQATAGAAGKPALRGPKAPGYFWEGPKKRAAQEQGKASG